MSGAGREPELRAALDRVFGAAAGAERRARARAAFSRGLTSAWLLVAALPGAVVALQLALAAAGRTPRLLSWPALALLALAAPPLAGAALAAASGASPSRRRALALADRRLGLADRLSAADEFLGRPALGPFERAAIEDARQAARRAAEADLTIAPAIERPSPLRALATLATALVLILISAHLAALGPVAAGRPGAPGAGDTVARGPALAGTERRSPDPSPPGREPAAEHAAERRAEAKGSARAPAPARGLEGALSEREKRSSGSTSRGRSAEARSTSGASDARGAPSSQGQVAKAQEGRPKPPGPEPARKAAARPAAERKLEAEDPAGATAGRGASKGSAKNTVVSDWSSRDQVATPDDAEVELDEDVDDEEEEQESRGGVQPSLRDRRPPVSRDLRIGFGNRPSPDANGRGGPSQPKKSRGVASLVLGVPIPDRVKGQPNPGKTKITQERVEPETEDAEPTEAASRGRRAAPAGVLPSPILEPWARSFLSRYFLSLRRGANRP